MIHPVPQLSIIADRAKWLVERATGRSVLDIGCTGPISDRIRKVASAYHGVDCQYVNGCDVLDIDHRPDLIPQYEDVDLVIASEVLEHLGNPGYFLLALKEHYPGRQTIITVPHAGGYSTHNGCEVVNKEHVAWYSYTTLKNLLTRYQFQIDEAYWANGEPHRAEGLIMVAR